MKQLAIHNGDATISFALCYGNELDLNGLDYLAKIKYEFYGRTIYAEHIWGFHLGEIASFIEGMKCMHRDLKGQAKLSTYEGDTLLLTMEECGHIMVDVKDGIEGYNGFLHISFEIDQSYLPELITQTESFCPIKEEAAKKKSFFQRLGISK